MSEIFEITLDDLIKDTEPNIDKNNNFCGETIRKSGIREKVNGLVIGIERNGKRILNPDSSTIFEPGDIVWIVGNKQKIKQLKN